MLRTLFGPQRNEVEAGEGGIGKIHNDKVKGKM
jgi:hypothetical protein